MKALILFYDQAHGKHVKYAFSKDFRHCKVITHVNNHFISIESDKSGIYAKHLDHKSIHGVIDYHKQSTNLSAYLYLDLLKDNPLPWFPFWIRSCNEVCRYVTAIDIGFTFNPKHMYNKILKHNGLRNYRIIDAWRR